MTKIALCISGQARSWEKCLERYVVPNLLNRNDVDVFFHTWIDPKLDIKKLYDLYKPIAGIVEEPLPAGWINEKYPNVADKSRPAIQTYSMYYSIAKAYELIESRISGITYDWVIRTRFDYAMNGGIIFDDLVGDKVYVPNCRMTPERDFCNDQFAYGSPLTMSKYCVTFHNLDVHYNAGVKMNGEDMLAANLKYYGLIGPNLVYVDMHNPFPPGPNNGTWHSLIRDDIVEWQK